MKNRALFCLLSVLGLQACSEAARRSDTDDRGRTDASHDGSVPYLLVEEEDYPQALSDAIAERYARCCEQAGLSFSASGTPFMAPDPSAGARYDSEAGSQCLAEIAREACRLQKDPQPPPSAACASVWTGGSRALGAPCKTSWECAPSSRAGVTVACSVSLTADGWSDDGKCYEQTFLNDGDSCTGSYTEPQCVYPSFCHPEQKRCVKPAALGEPCATSPQLGDTCEQGAVCDRRDTKRCVAPTPVGAACEAAEQCETLACRAGTCREPLEAIPLCDDDPA